VWQVVEGGAGAQCVWLRRGTGVAVEGLPVTALAERPCRQRRSRGPPAAVQTCCGVPCLYLSQRNEVSVRKVNRNNRNVYRTRLCVRSKA